MTRTIEVPRRVVWTALLVSTGIALVVCYFVGSQQLVLGDRTAGWLYPYVTSFNVRVLGVASLVIAGAVVLVRLVPLQDGRHEWFIVSTWILVAIALTGVVRSVAPYSMTDVFLSDGANAFYRVTQDTDARSVLSDFNRARRNWPLHAQSNMPGKIMFLFALQLLSTNPAVLPWLIVAVSSAGGALMYVFVRDLFSDRQVGLFALILYLFVPARLFFLPLLNTVTPVVFLGCACLVLRWLHTRNQWYAAAAGVAVYVLMFFEPLPLVMGVLLAALIARAIRRREISFARLTVDITAGALSFAATYLAVHLWLDFDLFDALRRIAAHAVEFNVNEGRPYAYWTRANVREFMFGMGICQAVLFVVALIYVLRSSARDISYLTTPLALLTTSLTAILVITDLLGVNRGEVIRLWIFLACFFQIPAAYLCSRVASRTAFAIVISTSLLHTTIAAAMIGFVVP